MLPPRYRSSGGTEPTSLLPSARWVAQAGRELPGISATARLVGARKRRVEEEKLRGHPRIGLVGAEERRHPPPGQVLDDPRELILGTLLERDAPVDHPGAFTLVDSRTLRISSRIQTTTLSLI